MIHELTPDERHLAELMRNISERCYSAGWMCNLEYVLWNAVVSGPRDYGHGAITKDDIDKLTQASHKISSWILFDEELEEIIIPLDKWRVKFSEDIRKKPDRLHS